MIYYLFQIFNDYNLPGIGLLQYISFRAGMAFLLSLFISIFVGKSIIKKLQNFQFGEKVRDLGLEGQKEKEGTPTFGGIIIIFAILISVLLFNRLENIYVLIMIGTMIFTGAIGFIDDYLKKKRNNKDGLAGKFKILGQVTISLIISLALFNSNDNTIVEKINTENINKFTKQHPDCKIHKNINVDDKYTWVEYKSLKTNAPFFKNIQFDYSKILGKNLASNKKLVWLIYFIIIAFIIVSVSNGANLTDGLDGLAAGTSSLIGFAIAILAYSSGSYIFADYLDIIFVPNSSEIVVFMAAFTGATIGFLWYNTYPAQVFMGDTGSLMIGSVIAVSAIIIRKELLLPLLCFVFFIESLSVVIQTSWFKYTRIYRGGGKRIFLMTPIHHHYQKKGIKEAKIVVRFWLVTMIFIALGIITLKIR